MPAISTVFLADHFFSASLPHIILFLRVHLCFNGPWSFPQKCISFSYSGDPSLSFSSASSSSFFDILFSFSFSILIFFLLLKHLPKHQNQTRTYKTSIKGQIFFLQTSFFRESFWGKVDNARSGGNVEEKRRKAGKGTARSLTEFAEGER